MTLYDIQSAAFPPKLIFKMGESNLRELVDEGRGGSGGGGGVNPIFRYQKSRSGNQISPKDC